MITFPPKQGEPFVLEFHEGKCKRCTKTLHRFRFDDYCQDCSYIVEQEIQKQKKVEHLAFLATMPIEVRLSKIEEWIYDHEQNHPRKDWVMR